VGSPFTALATYGLCPFFRQVISWVVEGASAELVMQRLEQISQATAPVFHLLFLFKKAPGLAFEPSAHVRDQGLVGPARPGTTAGIAMVSAVALDGLGRPSRSQT
jgi:hypothetical protein